MAISSRAAAVASIALFSAVAVTRADSVASYASNGDTAPAPTAMAADLLLARPLGFGATVLGTAIFIVGLPFELLAGNVSDPARKLVVEPAKFTFVRPLGEEIN